MACYMNEQQAFKCPKHPSKRRKTGICPKCLRDRLVTLCPECANPRPCACIPAPADTSSSSSSSPALLKSRSVAISFLRSRSRHVGGCHVETAANNNNNFLPPKVSRSKINFWSMFTVNKSKRGDVHDDGTAEELNKSEDVMVVDDNSSMMMRSRSVAVGGGNRFAPASSKQKGWYFPSPINAFRHSKPPRSVPVT